VEAELRFQVRLGEVYDSRLNDRARSIETYQGVLARAPQHRGALQALARLYEADDDNYDAAKILEQLLDMSESEEALTLANKLADVYERLKDPENVARALERGLGVDERNAGIRTRLRELYRAQEDWEKLGVLMAGDAEFEEDMTAKVRLLREAAEIHSNQRRDTAAAAELLEKASALVPDDRELLLQLCDAYSASGKGRAAAEVLEKIVESYGGNPPQTGRCLLGGRSQRSSAGRARQGVPD